MAVNQVLEGGVHYNSGVINGAMKATYVCGERAPGSEHVKSSGASPEQVSRQLALSARTSDVFYPMFCIQGRELMDHKKCRNPPQRFQIVDRIVAEAREGSFVFGAGWGIFYKGDGGFTPFHTLHILMHESRRVVSGRICIFRIFLVRKEQIRAYVDFKGLEKSCSLSSMSEPVVGTSDNSRTMYPYLLSTILSTCSAYSRSAIFTKSPNMSIFPALRSRCTQPLP